MLLNYFKIALRNLTKHKVFSVINIAGLSVGIACCLFIFLYIRNEMNYDRFHEKGERIYRVLRISETNGEKMKIPYTSGPYGPALQNDFPAEITHAVRVWPNDGLVVYGDKSFTEKKFFFVDSTFFRVFSFPLAQGDPLTALNKPNGVVISQDAARKYFGSQDPIGKIIHYDGTDPFEVTGVLAPLPGNSHLEFDFLASISQYSREEFFSGWSSNFLVTYVLLPEKVSATAMQARFPGFIDKYLGSSFKQFGGKVDLALQPLSEIYFGNHLDFDPSMHGDKQVIYLFGAVALFILTIACINFMNLSTARSAGRAKEVGMRKVMGARRTELVTQFLGESVLLTLVGVLLAIIIIALGLPQFSAFIGKPLFFPLANPAFWLFLLGVVVVVGLLAGMYPAFFLSAFQPIRVLKGKFTAGKQSVVLRKSLVVVQFSISVLLITGTFVIIRQLDYIQQKKLGYEKEHTLLVRISNDDIYNHRESFKNDLQRIGQVQQVSAMSGEPGGFHDQFTFDVQGKEGETWMLRTVFTDHNYAKTLGLKVIAGRDFSKSYGTDALQGVMLNQTAVKKLGWTPEEAIGKTVFNKMRDSLQRQVVGVVEDFHFSSLKEEIQPLAIAIGRDNRVVALKLAAGNPQSAIGKIEAAWRKVAPKYPFTYEFLDQVYDNLYKAEQKQRALLGLFAAVAIFVACLGLFGLAAFTAEQRTKEVSVRKVLGASVPHVILLLSKDFVKLVLVSILIATPLAWYLMNQWLQDFVYRIQIKPDVFVIAGSLAVLIAVLTVSYHAIRTALTNPARTLRSE